MYCPKCNLDNQTGAFCKSCGKFLDPSDSPSSASSASPLPANTIKEPPVETEVEPLESAPISVEEPLRTSLEEPAGTTVDEVPQEANKGEEETDETIDPAPESSQSSKASQKNKPALISLAWDYLGRTSRRNYVWFLVFSFVFGIVLLSFRDNTTLIAVSALAFVVVASSLAARRLRDAGFKMLWFLILLVPLLGPLTILTFLSFPSKSRATSKPMFLEVLIISGITLFGWLDFAVLAPGIALLFPSA